MAPRYLNHSELAYVRWAATEAMRWRRPRRANRVRAFAPQAPLTIPAPRRPVDVTVLHRVLAGLRALGEVG